MLALPAALTPAVARVHHATENYYRFPGLDDEFYWSLALCARSADLVVSVSSGVTSSLREHLPELGDALVEITNGCDFAQALAAPDPDPEIAALAARWDRAIVYAGNLNGRVDFELIVRIARAEPRSLVLLVGPVRGLNATERGLWAQLLEEPNVHHEEGMSADRLPAVYRAADVGIVPYLPLRELVDDGFPLKVLEMAATGLPMVSTMMRPIVDLHSGIRVVSDRDEFLAVLPATGRHRLGAEVCSSLVELASAHDYDKKFGDLIGHLRGRHLPEHPSTRYDVASRIDPQRTSAPLLAPDDFDAYPLATRVALRAAARTTMRSLRGSRPRRASASRVWRSARSVRNDAQRAGTAHARASEQCPEDQPGPPVRLPAARTRAPLPAPRRPLAGDFAAARDRLRRRSARLLSPLRTLFPPALDV